MTHQEAKDIFSVSSSIILGTTSGRSVLATVNGDQIVLTEAENPSHKVGEISVEAAYERIAVAAFLTRQQLEAIYQQHRKQAQEWFKASVAAAFIGFIAVLGGVLLAFLGYIDNVTFSVIGGVIPEIAAGLFYQQAARANRQLQLDQERLIDAERIHQAVELALTLDNLELRDKLKASIIKLALKDSLTDEGAKK